MTTSRVWIFGFLVVCLLASQLRAGEVGTDKAAVKQRLNVLQNCSVSYEITDTWHPIEKETKNNLKLQGNYVRHGVFRFLDGRSLFDITTSDATERRMKSIPQPVTHRTVGVFTHERVELLTENASTSHGVATIHNKWPLPRYTLIDVALGLRSYNDEAWFTPESLDAAVWTSTETGLVEAVFRESTSRPTGKVHRASFDPANGYALTQCSEEQDGFRYCDVSCSDFRVVDGIALPFKVVSHVYGRGDDGPRLLLNQALVVEGYHVHDVGNTPETFTAQYDSSAIIRDLRTGVIIKQKAPGPVTEAAIVAAAERRLLKSEEAQNTPKLPFAWLFVGGLVAVTAMAILIRMGRRLFKASEVPTRGA